MFSKDRCLAGGGPTRDSLHFEEFHEPMDAALTAVPGLFIAAKGAAWCPACAIHLHHAGTQLPRHPLSPFIITTLNVIR